MSDITSANVVLVIGSNEGKIPLGTIIKAYSPDTAISVDAVTTAEVSIGVDGSIYAGWVPQIKTLHIQLSASSISNKIFEAFVALQDLYRRAFKLSATYVVPATNTAYALTDGYLTSAAPVPTAGTTLQPREYIISFGGLTPVPLPDIAATAIADING